MPPLIENKEAAMRLARAIVSDVSLYNEAKIVKGIEDDNLFDTLSSELEEGRELYKSRVNPTIDPKAWYYDRAVVDVLLRPKGHIRSKIW